MLGNVTAVQPYNYFKDLNILFCEALENPGETDSTTSTLQMTTLKQ